MLRYRFTADATFEAQHLDDAFDKLARHFDRLAEGDPEASPLQLDGASRLKLELAELADTATDRVTAEQVRDQVVKQEYHVFSNRLTVCVLTLRNGFLVNGTSACVSEANFDPQLGKQLAFNDAVEKIWELEGYLLRERQHPRA